MCDVIICVCVHMCVFCTGVSAVLVGVGAFEGQIVNHSLSAAALLVSILIQDDAAALISTAEGPQIYCIDQTLVYHNPCQITVKPIDPEKQTAVVESMYSSTILGVLLEYFHFYCFIHLLHHIIGNMLCLLLHYICLRAIVNGYFADYDL